MLCLISDKDLEIILITSFMKYNEPFGVEFILETEILQQLWDKYSLELCPTFD